MKRWHYIVLISISFIFGFLVYCFAQNIVIIRWPFSHPSHDISSNTVSKKKVSLYFWHQGIWKHEEIELIWQENIVPVIHYMINAWLTLLDEEKITDKKVTLQSVALTPNTKEALLSFDRYPFDKKSSIYEKLLWFEGILKTIRENRIDLDSIQFLVHHQPLLDYHLDFSKPWPIKGFLINPSYSFDTTKTLE